MASALIVETNWKLWNNESSKWDTEIANINMAYSGINQPLMLNFNDYYGNFLYFIYIPLTNLISALDTAGGVDIKMKEIYTPYSQNINYNLYTINNDG